jgi:hypothetical protein
MATTETRKPQSRQKVRTEDLASGFSYLTLGPSPRLRQLRENQLKTDTFAEAWTIVGRAIRTAIQAIAKSTGQTKSPTR